jgi:hypothetical protein
VLVKYNTNEAAHPRRLQEETQETDLNLNLNLNLNLKEKTMNAFVSTLSRDLACAAAAAAITVVLAASFVQSTSTPPFGQTVAEATAVAAPAGQHV